MKFNIAIDGPSAAGKSTIAKKLAKELEKKMRQAAAELNFEEAASLRDRMIEVKKMLLDME